MKRFYKETAVDQGDGGHRILLDGKPMRTPAKAVLVVPTRALAEAIAAEWGAVPDKADINVSHLPLTRLAATGLDRVTRQRARVIEDTAKYAGSDMLCYRASEPETLVNRQQAIWQPLLDWADARYGARLVIVEGLAFVEQPAVAVARLGEAVATHSDLGLSALYNLTHISGSLIVALAVAEGHLAAADAFAAAQLDELYQVERWGEDPIATKRHEGIRHDIEAGARFLALLEQQRLKG
ncbi:MAG TPA: ATP12 family protein [Reyranella sp.]|nr:ATP12 family protein [Reyranella sp.]